MATRGSKDFGFYQPGPELRPEKVVTVTLGHPVLLREGSSEDERTAAQTRGKWPEEQK